MRPPSSYGRHGAPLPAPPHPTISQHVGRLLYAAKSLVGHHGSRDRPFRSRRVDGLFLLLWVVFDVGISRVTYWKIGDEVRKCIMAGIGAVGSAATTPNQSLLRVRRFFTSWGNDALRRWCQRRRNRIRRRLFLQHANLRIDRSWWSPSTYGRHRAPLPAFEHTTINKHTIRQDYVVKTRKSYH